MHSEAVSLSIIINSLRDPQIADSGATVDSVIAKAKAGDNQAFEALMIKYQRQVMGTSMRLLGNLDDARDAVQEVFLRLYKYLHTLDETRQVEPWLYRVTINVCRDLGRKRASSIHVSYEQEVIAGNMHEISSSSDIEADLGLAQEKQIIREALETLSEKERSAVVLRDLEGLTTEEVAKVLGSSAVTVRSQISMARVKIKKYRDRILRRRQK
jgi:RNA polymerase sigma-70 factor (ECF subfamily)